MGPIHCLNWTVLQPMYYDLIILDVNFVLNRLRSYSIDCYYSSSWAWCKGKKHSPVECICYSKRWHSFWAVCFSNFRSNAFNLVWFLISLYAAVFVIWNRDKRNEISNLIEAIWYVIHFNLYPVAIENLPQHISGLIAKKMFKWQQIKK